MPDSHLEMERLIDELAPDMLPSAKRSAIETYAPLFIKTGKFDGKTLEEFVRSRAVEAPHWFPSAQAVDLQEQAFGSKPTLRARGELFREVGAANYATLAAEWGSDAVSLKPGTAPAGSGHEIKKPSPAERLKNPWSKQGWNLTKQMGLVRSLGAEKSAAIARAVGCKIGDTKFNPDYN
jgi:hypothetical protein